MNSYSLIDEPWIPVRFRRDASGDEAPVPLIQEVGLREALLRAHEILEVEAGTPPVTAALNRLLLAVSMDAFDTADEDDWFNLWEAEQFDSTAIHSYFDAPERRDRFDLLHPEYPFYQDAQLREALTKSKGNPKLKTDSLSKLFLDEHTNAILFNHAYAPKTLSLSEAARGIVAAQAASPSDGRSAQLQGEATIRGKAPAMLLNKTMFWLRGRNLFEALLLNAPPAGFRMSGVGQDEPNWETGPPGASDSGGREPHGPLDYLTWQARRFLLEIGDGSPGNEPAVVGVKVVQGAKLPKDIKDDPLLAYEASGSKGLTPYQVKPGRALWRDLSVVLIPLQAKQTGNVAPRIIEWAVSQRNLLGRGTQWSLDAFFVRNEPGPGGAGKIDFWRHERIPLHPELLSHVRLLGAVEGALRYADHDVANSERGIVQKLVDAAFRYVRLLLYPTVAPPSNPADRLQYLNKKQRADVRALVPSLEVEPRFWAQLEEPFYKLLGALAALTHLPLEEASAAAAPHLEAWQAEVRHAACYAFRDAVASFGSDARALRALAEAEAVLYPTVR